MLSKKNVLSALSFVILAGMTTTACGFVPDMLDASVQINDFNGSPCLWLLTTTST
jgi:hypothetical protein